ncbi:prepilin-type N-terminal cleavage/methylation domain-containing protein [Samsonia erythrinae]|uniref:Prepilin peptidase dependent protein C n=1 Tax=Samsonia erythrinae TaxID=160434 RepID=A0A4R3VNN2_9GAMM|nr:prepilin-type N-terminal cleavage/methylation domain-containing protein [Samsonia erythrinae]TCV08634.1 prepilin peptidase dependent protein C [Samsonia erythrinae]
MAGSATRRRSIANQSGFSLPETLAAALLFTVSLNGLLQYHQILQQSFQHQWQQRQAWRLASQLLDAYEAGIAYHPSVTHGPTSKSEGGMSGSATLGNSVPSLEKRWQFTVSEGRQKGECRQVVARVMTPRRYQATLDRWFCRLPAVE